MKPRSCARLRRLALGLCAMAASGCAVGPDFHRPAPPAGHAYRSLPASEARGSGPSGAEPQALLLGAEPSGRWWTLFHSAALDALEDEALKANPDLAAAEASLRQAHQLYLAQKGALAPTVDLSAQTLREKDSAALSPTLAQPVPIFTLYTGRVDVSYRLDLFGGVRRQVEQAGAQAEQQHYLYEAAYVSLTANVAAAAIQVASLNDQIRAQDAVIAEARDVLQIEQRREAEGQVAGADVAAQTLAVAQAQAAMPPLRKALGQQEDLIAALIGKLPGEAPWLELTLADLSLPSSLPVSLPSRLADQRPDIRAAEAALHAASAAVGAAEADRLPDLELTGSFGGASTTLADLLLHSNQAWAIAGGVTQPLFHGGALMHRQKAAEAGLDQARAQYRSTVIAAFQNVSDVLEAIDDDAAAYAAAIQTEAAARQALAIGQSRARLGAVSGADILVLEEALQAALSSRAQIQAARYADSVALYQALGGGWWDRTGHSSSGN